MHTTFNIVPMSEGEEERELIYNLQFVRCYGNMFQVAEHMGIGMGMFTCSYEHDIILAIFCLHLIHHDLSELVFHVCFDYDGPIVDGVNRVKHGRVAPSKGHNIIRELFSGVIPSKCFAWTLWSEQVSLKPKGGIRFEFQPELRAYCARPRVGNPSLEGDPLVVWSISMGVRTQKHPPNVCHVVHAHSWAFEDVAKEWQRVRLGQSDWTQSIRHYCRFSFRLPGSSKNSIDHRALGIFCAYKKNILCKP